MGRMGLGRWGEWARGEMETRGHREKGTRRTGNADREMKESSKGI